MRSLQPFVVGATMDKGKRMNDSKEAKQFRKRLVKLRGLRDITQVELAQRAGMQPAAISQFESGTRTPAFDSLIKMADAMNITVDYLIGRNHKTISAGPSIDKLMRHAEQLTPYELDLLTNLAKILANKNKENKE